MAHLRALTLRSGPSGLVQSPLLLQSQMRSKKIGTYSKTWAWRGHSSGRSRTRSLILLSLWEHWWEGSQCLPVEEVRLRSTLSTSEWPSRRWVWPTSSHSPCTKIMPRSKTKIRKKRIISASNPSPKCHVSCIYLPKSRWMLTRSLKSCKHCRSLMC